MSARERELATLRAIGFGGFPLAIAVIAEGLVLALLGALLGAGTAWLLFNGRGEAEATYVFALLINGEMLWLGCVWAAAIALLGGLLPAIRAASFPVARALART